MYNNYQQYPSYQYPNTNLPNYGNEQQNYPTYYNSPFAAPVDNIHPKTISQPENQAVIEQNSVNGNAVSITPESIVGKNVLPQINEYVIGGSKPVVITTQTSDGITPTKEVSTYIQF